MDDELVGVTIPIMMGQIIHSVHSCSKAPSSGNLSTSAPLLATVSRVSRVDRRSVLRSALENFQDIFQGLDLLDVSSIHTWPILAHCH